MRDSHLLRPSLGRRRFLVGMAAAGVLVACGGDDDAVSDEDVDGGSDGTVDGESELTIFRTYGGPVFAAGAAIRAPFSLGDAIAPLDFAMSPESISVRLTGPAGSSVDETFDLDRRGTGLPRPYYSLEFTPDIPGFYDYTVTAGDLGSQTAQVTVDDPAAVTLVGVGDEMPALLTPTVDDARGLESLCTRVPPCDLHDSTVAEAIGDPFVLLVSSPAYCNIGVCGPILDLLLAEQVPGLRFIHAEPFISPPTQTGPGPSPDYIAELGLSFEPAAYSVDASGVVVARLDFVFDSDELADLIRSVGSA